ncbi:MAG: MFS transporter [Candidatus Bathyarchaeota archaeon]|nr:MAG: MFS transporter [Candidatus Bathyarchaeota archaeon]
MKAIPRSFEERFYGFYISMPLSSWGFGVGNSSNTVKEKMATPKDESEPFVPSLALYGTAACTFFSDSLLWYFLFPYAAVLKVAFAEMGVIRSVRNLFQYTLQIGWGGLVEKFGKRLFVFAGYLLSSITVLALLYFHTPFQLLAIMISQAIFWSMGSPAWNALLGDYTKMRTRGKVLGKIMSVGRFSGVGATLFIALIAFWTPGELTPSSFVMPFALSAAVGVVGGILVAFVKERKPQPTSNVKLDAILPMRDKSFRIFLVVNCFFWFAMAFAWPLFPYVTVDIVKAELWQIALIATASGLVASLTQPKFGSIADRIGRKPLIVASHASFVLFPLMYAFANHWLHLLASNAILGFALAASIVTTTAYILDSAPIGKRATYTGAYNLIIGCSSFLGSFVGGVFTDYLSTSNGVHPVIFMGLICSAALRLITSMGFLTIVETIPSNNSFQK